MVFSLNSAHNLTYNHTCTYLYSENEYTGTMSKLTVETVTLNICIPGVQAEAMSPLVTHLSKTCEDHGMNNQRTTSFC